MINPKELRIGNLFYPSPIINGVRLPQYIPCQVLDIKFGCISGCLANLNPAQHEWNEYGYHDLSSIPLTPEILEKFGFEKIGGGYWSEKAFLLLTEYHGYYGFKYNLLQSMPIQIQSLHQLQNLYFALCGEELNVQL